MKEKLKARQLCVQKASRNGTAARFVQSMANVPVAQVRSQQLETLVDTDVLLNVAVGRKTFVDESSAVVDGASERQAELWLLAYDLEHLLHPSRCRK